MPSTSGDEPKYDRLQCPNAGTEKCPPAAIVVYNFARSFRCDACEAAGPIGEAYYCNECGYLARHSDNHDQRCSQYVRNPIKEAYKDGAKIKLGRKFDQGKLRWSLLPWEAVRQIVDVLEYGATKYAPDNWKHVGNWRERYFNAMQRHILAWWGGEQNDPETGLHHLAHAGCCLVFLLWKDTQ